MSAATLTGLLAVALSINPKRIMSSSTHAARSREALIAFLILILLSILMPIPGQAPTFLGTELVILGLCGLATAFSLQYRTLGLLHKSLWTQWLARIALLDSGSAFLVVGGLSLLLGNGEGLYWLVPTIFICLMWSLFNSWQLIVWLPEEAKERPN